MRPKSTLRAFLLGGPIAAILTSSAQAATFYWDNNGTVLGFGDAGGTWAQNSTSGGTSARWKTDPTGVIAGSVTQGTANADIFHFGTTTLGLGSGTITVNGSVTMGDTFYGSASGEVVLSGGTINFGAAKTITVNNTTNTISSIIGGAATSLTKTGAGALVLTGSNTYTGTTIISAGTLDLGGGTANGSLASTVLTLNGGSLSYTRAGSTTQGFTTTNINGGGTSGVSAVAGNTLNLGTVNRGAGGFINFSNVGAGTVAALAVSNDSSGIMAGLNFGDTWAVANGAGVAISGLANGSYTQSSAALDTAASYTGLNIDVDSSQTLDDAITANSLRFSSTAANSLTLQGTNVVTSGGILVGSGVGSNLSTITGGTLAGAASQDLSIIQNNTSGGLTISSVIANNDGATALTMSGAGLLTLDNSNTFTGGVFVNGGRLTLANAGALNSTVGSENAVTFGTGSTGILTLGGNSVVIRSLNTDATTPGTAVVENASGNNATLTIGNSGNASSSFAGVIQDGTGVGTLTLTKAGAGTLTLSGPNTYSGGTTLSAGTVVINNATSFGGGAVSVTGASQIHTAVSMVYANAIDVGANLTLKHGIYTVASANPGGTAEFTGVLSGSADITIAGSNSGNVQANLFFSNDNNTFTGSVISATGNANGADYFRFNSIGDGGTFTFDKSGNRGGVIYSGASGIEFDTRQIVLGTALSTGNNNVGGYTTTLSGLNGNGVPVNSFVNNASNAAHTVTFNTEMAMTTFANNSIFYFDGSNTGDNTFAGDIGNPTSAHTLGIGKWGTGKWILSGDNSFEGDLVVANGILAATTIDNAGNNQSIGRGSLVILGHANTNGTLEYIGSANTSTDKQIVLGNIRNNNQAGAGGIANNGDGTLTFTNDTFNSIAGNTLTNRARSLTLGGTNTGANEIQGTIQNNAAGAAVDLTKTGTGTWILSGDNTYTGTTNVTGGALIINGSTSTGTVAVTGGTLGGNGGTIGGATTIGATGTLAPGQSPGTLTFLNTLGLAGSAIMEIDGNSGAGVVGGHDFVNLTGAEAAGVLTYGGTMTIDIGTIFGVGNYSWDLFDFASETGTFTGITLADQYSGSLVNDGFGVWDLTSGNDTWTFTQSTGVLGLNVIPEPSAALLGGLGLLVLLRRRR